MNISKLDYQTAKTFREYGKRLHELSEEFNKPFTSDAENVAWYFRWGAYAVGIAFMMMFSIPILIYDLFSYGFVGTKFWAWFIVPTFHVEPLTLLSMVGIVLLIRLFTHKPISIKEAEENANRKLDDKKVLYTLAVLAAPWVSLLTGYIVHRLM